MVEVVKLDVLHNSRAELSREPGDVGRVSQGILLAGEKSNGNVFPYLAGADQGHNLRAVVLDVVCIVAVVVLAEDAALDDLSVVNQLLRGGTALGQTVLESFRSWVGVGRVEMELGGDGIADRTELVAEIMQSLVDLWVSNLVDLQVDQTALDVVPLGGDVSEHLLLAVREIDNWSKCNKQVDLLVQVCGLRKVSKHLRCTLGVSDVGELAFSCSFQNVIDLSRHIVHAELVEAVVEEQLIVPYWVYVGVLTTVEVATIVAEPNVESSVG